MNRRPRRDGVPPELAAYIANRDRYCVVRRLADRGDIYMVGPCSLGLTIAHVRDARGGRMGLRPPSTPRRLALVCEAHHTDDPVVDRRDVRPFVDRYLEELEGPDADQARPWEVVSRVRGNLDWRPSEKGGTDAATRTEGEAPHPRVRRRP